MDEDVDVDVMGMVCGVKGTEGNAGFKSKAMSCADERRPRKSLLLVAVALGAAILHAVAAV
jgi:hypothetical protein